MIANAWLRCRPAAIAAASACVVAVRRRSGVLLIAASLVVFPLVVATTAARSLGGTKSPVARSPAARSPAAMTAVPADAAPGSVVALIGSGLPRRSRGTVSIGSVRVGRFSADSRGDWSLRALVPLHTRARSTRLRVVVGARVIVAPFSVMRSAHPQTAYTSVSALSTGEWVRLASTHVGAGSSVALQGTGFGRQASVEIWLANERLATLRAGRRGAVRGSARVPRSTQPGAYAVTVRSHSRRLRFILFVSGRAPKTAAHTLSAPAFDALSKSPPLSAAEGVAYNYTFAATGNPAPTLGLAPGAPGWLTINPRTGRVSGAPPPGSGGTSVEFRVTATNSQGMASIGPFIVDIAPVFTAASPPTSATEGVAYAYAFAASGNAIFALAGGAPGWLSINPNTGVVSGTPPTGAGGYSVTYSVIAGNGHATAAAGPFSIGVAWAQPTIGTIPHQTVAQLAPMTPINPATTGNVTAFSASGLPPGISIDQHDGTISGAATQSGAFTSTVTVSGPGGSAATSISWTIGDPVVDAVGDMGCAFSDPNYNNGNGNPNVPAGSNACLQKYVSDLAVNPLPSAFLDLGDNQYDSGSLFDFQHVFDPTYGRANAVTYPSLGNAEYGAVTSATGNSNASGFFSYFGPTTTFGSVFARIKASIATYGGDASHIDMPDGYYSFNIGTWHIIALNSNCGTVTTTCDMTAEQQWLQSDLAATKEKCILAYWHHPRWNSGTLGNDSRTAGFWTALYNAHATLVLNGHANHHYEVFKPQDPTGAPVSNGIREFIVSTGGQSHGVAPSTPGDVSTSQVTNYDTFGVLKLTLHASSYDWQFVPASDGQPGHFTDSGSGSCN